MTGEWVAEKVNFWVIAWSSGTKIGSWSNHGKTLPTVKIEFQTFKAGGNRKHCFFLFSYSATNGSVQINMHAQINKFNLRTPTSTSCLPVLLKCHVPIIYWPKYSPFSCCMYVSRAGPRHGWTKRLLRALWPTAARYNQSQSDTWWNRQ